jgi:acyl-CoA synthetase (AMP-forming)/AMP-acid ligase II
LGEGPGVRRPRWLLSAGAPLPQGLFQRALERFGQPIRQDYGTTETGTIAIDSSAEVTEGVAGAPLEHMEVKLGSSGPGGEVLVRSPAVSSGYLTEEGLEPDIDADGWYHTGDIGTVEDGGLRLTSRLMSPILVGEQSVDPASVERILKDLPGVREAIVVAAPDGIDRQILKAVVVAESKKRAEIEAALRACLLDPHVPARVEIREDLPTSPAGKILRKYLT